MRKSLAYGNNFLKYSSSAQQQLRMKKPKPRFPKWPNPSRKLSKIVRQRNPFNTPPYELVGFGRDSVTLNVHLLNHLHLHLDWWGPLTSCWAMPFEGYLSSVRCMITGKRKISTRIWYGMQGQWLVPLLLKKYERYTCSKIEWLHNTTQLFLWQ